MNIKALVFTVITTLLVMPVIAWAETQTYVGRFTVDSFSEEMEGAFEEGDVFEFQFAVDYDGLVLGNSASNTYNFAGQPTLTRVSGSGTWNAAGAFGENEIGGVDLGFMTDLNLWLLDGVFTPAAGMDKLQIWFFLDLDYSLVPAGSTLSAMLGGALLEDANDGNAVFNMNWSNSNGDAASVGGTFVLIPVAVPEPGPLGLLILGAWPLLARRQRKPVN